MHFDEEQVSAMGNEKPSSTGFTETHLENTSFAITPERLIVQAVTPEQVLIRLHAPQVRSHTIIHHNQLNSGDSTAVPGRAGRGGEALGRR
jgi:hypothetical protein